MAFIVVIPARYGSTRLTGKALLPLGDKPIIQYVHEQAVASGAERVIIATDHDGIREAAEGFGATVVMTGAHHQSGTDRIHEALAGDDWPDDTVVVNVQGDEPFIPPAVIDQVAGLLATHPGAGMATLCEPVREVADIQNPNVVKVVADATGRALYFSRAPIPWDREGFGAEEMPGSDPAHYQRHLGVYAYRWGFLQDFVRWPPAPLEKLEKLEQLRALYHGAEIRIAPACARVRLGIDTREDYELAMALIARDRAAGD